MVVDRLDDMLSITRAARFLGVSARTMRRYTEEGLLPDRRSPGGWRIFNRRELETLRAQREGRQAGVAVAYARVSSRRQAAEGDLDRQVSRLVEHLRGRAIIGPFSDVASGLSDRRPGLAKALDACSRPEVSELVVVHRERLARFGTGAIERLLAAQGVSLVVISADEAIASSEESELVRDMLAVVTSFSGRLYGQRSAKARQLRHCVRKAAVQGA
jgi:predicted site-specific integrase-resolvase